jgi:hypothetical protein
MTLFDLILIIIPVIIVVPVCYYLQSKAAKCSRASGVKYSLGAGIILFLFIGGIALYLSIQHANDYWDEVVSLLKQPNCITLICSFILSLLTNVFYKRKREKTNSKNMQ